MRSALPLRLPVLLCLLALFAGCARFTPRPVAPDRIASDFEARTLASPEVRGFIEKNTRTEIRPWPPERWDFGELLLAALYYSPGMDVARARWAVSEAGVKTAGGRPNPSVGILTQYDANSPGGLTPWTLGLSFDIPIETANKRGYRIAAATHFSEAGRLGVAEAAWTVRSALRARLLDLYGAGESVGILRKKLELYGGIVMGLEERAASGESSSVEVTAARVALEDARTLFLKARAGVADSRARLAASMGLPASALDGVEFSYPFSDSSPGAPPEALQRRALTGRADILASLEKYRASEAELQNEVARQYPDIHIGPGYSWDQEVDKWAIGVTLTLPVFNRNAGPIAEAEARRTEAGADLKALQARIIGELGVALTGYRTAVERLKAADGLLAEGRKRLDSAHSLFEAGETGGLAYLGAGLEFETLKEARLESFIEVQRSIGRLEDALQRPSDEWSGKGARK